VLKVIVTGGAGFIGSHLVDYLIKKKVKVLVIDNLSYGFKQNLNPKASFKKLDIKNGGKVNKIFQEFLPDFVAHLAGITSKSPSDKNRVFKTNVLGTANILKACVRNKVKKIIFSSSAAVYGETNMFPTGENQKLSPINPYGLSKAKAESKILAFSGKYNLNYSILRYSNVYGPRQRDDSEGGVISIFCKQASLFKNATIYGDGLQTRDFIFIDDVIKANYLSLVSPKSFAANVSTGKETNIINLIKIIEKVSKKKVQITFKPARKGEIKRSCPNNSLIKQKIDWKPLTKLETGIKKTYSYVTNSKHESNR
jgi:UDP-glucose 4-epimerase